MSNDIPKPIREGVKKRDMGRCVACGAEGSDVHHRMRRRNGGHSLENCLLLCRTDHSKAHAQPAWARTVGLIVPTYVGLDDVTWVPIRAWRGWVLHGRGGLVIPIREKPESALEWFEMMKDLGLLTSTN